MILEVCCDSIDSVRAAAAGGASRVELCSALGEGGVTPSAGLIAEARKIGGIALHVLIRPRGGDFLYDRAEVDCMVMDIDNAVRAGADGVVIGALSPDGNIDIGTCRRLVGAAGSACRNITFHRAFDLCRDPFRAIDEIVSLGCNRILTSGMAGNAMAGAECLKRLVEYADGRLSIMPGGGVGPHNARAILDATGCVEIHGSLRSAVDSAMGYRRPGVAMGVPGADEYSRMVASTQLVAETVYNITGNRK